MLVAVHATHLTDERIGAQRSSVTQLASGRAGVVGLSVHEAPYLQLSQVGPAQ